MSKYDAQIEYQKKLAVWAGRVGKTYKQSQHEAAVKYWTDLKEQEAKEENK